ncbi:type IV pilin biogenesis protein [Pseudenhygromyxa sp. WMMC2535]|uniref:type IV pilin biogenesis protein n=1 Tax=Pseudenhygromyxa sp. WMMC2535 TaxID=2712867 RepID=UPI001556C02E|nr:type IV pilin biogenesis protein [Pseudenhygromyxa sp. WMMC2535]NVB36665.1 type IV pilin biogenesis protein [Pseudenhygromyxa sp. WMMC2535]
MNERGPRPRPLGLLGLLMLAAAVFGLPRPGAARLDPFYIVHGQSFGAVTPRILFVLDTSGSMGFEQPWPDKKCSWDECEDDEAGSQRSRMTVARQVIGKIVADNEDTASFGLMTFGMAKPPKSSSEVPYRCYSWDLGRWVRFAWVTYVNQPYSNVWKPLTNAFGGQGTWMLCGDNRPFPYLRHDELGGFELPNNSSEALPDQPLVVAKASHSALKSSANYDRKVQFFPRFLGRRVNLDCSDPNQEAIVAASHGDWGENASERATKVCGHDFYYWPYVDGNPGYSYYSGYSFDDLWHVECDDNGSCSSTTSHAHRLGVTRRNQNEGASLYVPFYSEAVLADDDVPAEDKGPQDEDDQREMLRGLTDKSYAGGVDLSGGTPWAVAIGELDYMVKTNAQGQLELKSAVAKSNAAFAHETVGSYLSYLTLATDADVCRPTVAILVSDGQPDPWSSQGGTKLYSRLRKLRAVLGVKTYMVGFSDGAWNDSTKWERMHHIACAAAGADSVYAPCEGDNPYAWDTCRDSEDPADGCAWLASDDEELADALTTIIEDSIHSTVPAGPPTLASDFQSADPDDPEADDAAVQTSISAWTETPGWFGHVAREACDDEDPDNPGQLADYCAAASELALDSEESESFGPCPLGRVWDAGECLAQTEASARRLYTHDASGQLVTIAVDGQPTPEFIALVHELDDAGELQPPLTVGSESQEIAAMVDLLLGASNPEDWKLPGIANAAPLLVRRIPRYDSNYLPGVGIRDPHCAGRRNALGDDVPATLQSFAGEAWALSEGGGLAAHYDYAEAVLVGDDFGLVHAFHYDSGNELFAFLPRALVNNARVLALNGPQGFGQPDALAEHVYGVASTVNAGWIFDDQIGIWRHLAVFGFGPGGAEIVALDVSHMGRLQEDDPVEVLWTSETSGLAARYEESLGQTWSRPALTYAVPNDLMSVEPRAYLVFGSGYAEAGQGELAGRVLWKVDALTGEASSERALMAAPEQGTSFDDPAEVAAVGDVVVTSHCLSRYWGEMQEAYLADPAGRLYRWDLAASGPTAESFAHAADSGGAWTLDAQGFAQAKPALRLPACQGAGDFSCSISPIGQGGSKGEVFVFSPAVAAKNRIDAIDDPGEALAVGERDQLLIALASGSPNDAAIDGGEDDNDFHSSLYLLVDDHREDPEAGFDVPAGAPAAAPGTHPHYMRLPLAQIERTRTIAYPDGSVEDQTRAFSRRARPLRAPLIRVTGAFADDLQTDAEIFYVTYTIYEPGDSSCDPRWYDEDEQRWVYDQGATYELELRLISRRGQGFDFQTGEKLPGEPDDGFGTSMGLVASAVRQIGDCDDGNCGAVLAAPESSPCNPNEDAPVVGGITSIQTGWTELDGFSPLEIPL